MEGSQRGADCGYRNQFRIHSPPPPPLHSLNAQFLIPNAANSRRCSHQVYNATQSYVTPDKYKGREIKTNDFASILVSFRGPRTVSIVSITSFLIYCTV